MSAEPSPEDGPTEGAAGAPSDAPVKDLAKHTTRGLSWNLIGNLGSNAIRVVTIPVLGRLLLPHEFGLVAAALTVIAFATFLKDAGVGTALVQRKQLTTDQIHAAFSFSVMFGVGLGAVMIATAPLVSEFYELPDLTPIVQALALMFVIRGVATVPTSMARRQMKFRALALIDLGSYFVGSVLTVVMAYGGSGAWALVAGYLCETTLGAIAVIVLQPTRYTPIPQMRHLRDLLNYGAGHTFGELAGYFAYQGDNMVVGHQLGARALGLYTRAYDLMRFPSVAFSNVAGAVLFSAFSRIQDDADRLGRIYRRALFGTSVLLLPISAGLLVLAPELISILLGKNWSEAVLPFQILAFSMLPRTTFKLGATIARAAGDVVQVGLANVLYGVMVIGGALIAVRWGTAGVAAATAIAVYVNFALVSHLGLRRTTLSWGGFLAVHVEPLIVTAVVAAVVWPAAVVLRGAHLSPYLVVVIASLAGFLVSLGPLIVGVRRRQPDWMWFYDGLSKRLRFLPQVKS